LSDDLSQLNQRLQRAYGALTLAFSTLRRSPPMVQGSFYLLRRKCGKPNCRCARGQLHASWVLSRSEAGKDRLYSVSKSERLRVRLWAAEYRRYHRARALFVKRQAEVLSLADQIAHKRLVVWPAKKPPP
jgi:hypothetical protein